MYTALTGRRAGIVSVVPLFGSRTLKCEPHRGGVIVNPQARQSLSMSAIVQSTCGFARIRSRRSIVLATVSCRTRRQTQAGQVELAVLGIPQEADTRHHGRSDCPQPSNDLSSIIHATHVGVAGGEMAMHVWVAGILLNRDEQPRHCLLEPPT